MSDEPNQPPVPASELLEPNAAKKRTDRPLSRKHYRFIQLYLIDLDGPKSVLRAGFKVASARRKAYKLLRHPLIAAEIAKALKAESDLANQEAVRVRRKILAQAYANPNEIVQHRRDACRHCHGADHRYQFTPAELEKARDAHDPAKGDFDERGGLGFDPRRTPHPECPECHGDGQERVYITDTRNLGSEALALYAGTKQTSTGIEVKFNSQDKARELLARIYGLPVDRHEHTGKDGAPLAQPMLVVTREEAEAIDRKLDDEV